MLKKRKYIVQPTVIQTVKPPTGAKKKIEQKETTVSKAKSAALLLLVAARVFIVDLLLAGQSNIYNIVKFLQILFYEAQHLRVEMVTCLFALNPMMFVRIEE